MNNAAVIGSFKTAEAALDAVSALRQDGFGNAMLYSPVNGEEIQTQHAPASSSIGFLAFGGAVAGAMLGLVLTIHTSTQWPLMTGGQPIVSMPPFLVISFELTILFGVLATLTGFFWQIRRSQLDSKFYDPRFSVDRFGVYVSCGQERAEIARNLLSSAGAEEVRDERL
jgi:hypothetical protein